MTTAATTAAAALPRADIRPAPASAQLPLRTGQAAGAVAGPPGYARVLDRPGAVRGRHQFAELVAERHGLRPLDESDRLGGTVGGPGVFRQLGTAATGRSGRRGRLRQRGPARHLATPARRRAVTPADFRGKGAGEPHDHDAVRGRTDRLGHRRRTRSSRQPAAGGPRRPTDRARARGRCGPARLDQRAGADAGIRGGRAPWLGRVRPFSARPRDTRAARLADADCAAAPATRRRPRCPAGLRLHRLARAGQPNRPRSAPSSLASRSASSSRWPPSRSPTCSSCAATSPIWRTTGSAAAFSYELCCHWRLCSQSWSG